MGISFNAATLLNGNGINVNQVVAAIQNGHSGQLSIWQQEQADLATQAGLLSGYNNDLTNLAAAVRSLADPLGPLTALTANSTNPSEVTATAQASASAGVHQVTVNNVATTSSAYSTPIASGSSVPQGSFTLQVGDGATATVSVNTSGVTLDQLATYINGQNYGVSASVITDANGSRLSLNSATSGLPGNLTISNDTIGLNFTAVAGANASLTVDGAPINSTSNTVTSAIPGVTLNLLGSSPGNSVQISVGTDTSQATQAITNFVSAYNTIVGDINQQFSVDPTTNREGILGSDSSLRALQSSLLADASYAVSGNSGLVNLASLGINTQNDGTLSVDPTALNAALTANPAGFQNFFQNSSSTGFATNFNADLTNLTDPTQGVLSLDLTQNTSEQTDLTNQISNFQTQLDSQKQQLLQQFSTVNASLEEYPFLLQEVTSQLGLSNGSTNNTPTQATSTAGATTGG